MRPSEIENWALNIIDQVTAGQSVEDSRVELKSELLDDHDKAARRIAGHANAARGEHILWLLGVNEDGSVQDISIEDFAKWYAQVESRFDGLAPSLQEVRIPVGTANVIAMHFETDRAPFVVKNSKGGGIDREVPWREGTRTMSAKREHLIKLLVPLQNRPAIEIVACDLILTAGDFPSVLMYSYEIKFALFLTQPSLEETVIPSHKCNGEFEIGNIGRFSMQMPFMFWGNNADNINAGKSFISVRGPGLFEIRTQGILSDPTKQTNFFDDDLFDGGVCLALNLYAVQSEASIQLEMKIPDQISNKNSGYRSWRVGEYNFASYQKVAAELRRNI